MKNEIYELAREFSSETHGSSSYNEDPIFVMGSSTNMYVPLKYISKKYSDVKKYQDLQEKGFVFSSADFIENDNFSEWYKKQFNKKLTIKAKRQIGLLHYPDELEILDAVETVVNAYSVLRKKHVITNGKNLPVQLGEWYAKCILGLKQIKSSSQRGFDFYTADEKRVEVITYWKDRSSPKGVKIRKSLVEMSDYCIILYMNDNFMMRDILLLDSDFIMRKFAEKGHTVYLKDNLVSAYFFSVSSKHLDKVVNKSFLMKFSSPALVMKLDDRL